MVAGCRAISPMRDLVSSVASDEQRLERHRETHETFPGGRVTDTKHDAATMTAWTKTPPRR
jgi:hypothetical protein